MAMTLEGTICFVDPTKDVSEKMKARTFAIDTSVEFNGKRYTSYVGAQCTFDKCALLDDVNVGDKVKVSYDISGFLKKKDGQNPTEKNPNGEICPTNINVYAIEILERKTQPQNVQNTSIPSVQAPVSPDPNQPPTKDDLPF